MSFCTDYKTVTTRKPHRCIYCSRVIPKGEKVGTWGWADDGTMQRLFSCKPCEWWVDNQRDNETEISEGERMEDFYVDCPACSRSNMASQTEQGNKLELECDNCGRIFKRPYGWGYEEFGCEGKWQEEATPDDR